MSMIVKDEIPQWAKERADDLCDAEVAMGNIGSTAMFALSRYIAQHEQPPVDPDLVKAREICARVAHDFSSIDILDAYRAGKFDDEAEVQFALSALKEARNGA